MNGQSFQSLIHTFTTCVVMIAALCDLKSRRIPNVLTVPAIVMGLSAHTIHSGWSGLAFSLWGLMLGGGLFLLFHLIGAMGAGDVKLMGGIGALLGLAPMVPVLILTGIIGGFMAMGKIAIWYARRYAARRAALKTGTLAEHIGDEISGFRPGESPPLKQTIPYGVAIAAGTLITLIMHIAAGGIS